MTALLRPQEAAALLLAGNNYLILSHRRPDGDTVGSCAALCRALRAMGKRAWVYANPQFTPKYAPYLEGLIAPDGEAASHAASGDEETADARAYTFLSCDVASRSQLPFGMENAEVRLSIDHHGTNDLFADGTLVNPKAAACGELLTDLIPLLGVTLDRAMAEALYVAISTDTGCFRYSNVTADTFRCAGRCVEAGAEIYPINRRFFETKSRPRLALEAWLVEHMEYSADGRVALSVIELALMERLGLTEDDVNDIAGFGRTIEGVEIAVMLREVENGMGKVSVRTSPAYSAARICAQLGGGGHPTAAGASVPGGIPAARKAAMDAVAKEIELSCQTES